jgi:4-amino-4-deoxy-L-arabinose transferase-like glycosyltransferase
MLLQCFFVWWDELEARSRLWLVMILVLSLGLRAMEFAIHEEPEKEPRRSYFAQSIAEGRGLTGCTFFFPLCGPGNDVTASVVPLPPLVFAAAIVAFDDQSHTAIVVLHIILGVVTTALIYQIVLRLFDSRRSALLGAFLYAIYVPAIRLGSRLQAETICIFLLSLAMLAVISGISSGRLRTWLLAGLSLGLAAQSREALVYFPFVLVLFVPLITAGGRRQRLLQAGALLFAFSITLTPWIVRNALVFHGFVPGGTLNGYNLYRHNYLVAGENYLRHVRMQEAIVAVEHLLNRRTDLRGNLNEFEMDRVYRQEAIKIIQAHPVRYLHLSLYRFLLLFRMNELGLAGLTHIVFLPLAVATVLRRHFLEPPGMVPVVLLIAYYTAGHMLVNASIRYIVPMMPFVMVLTADQLDRVVTQLINRIRKLSNIWQLSTIVATTVVTMTIVIILINELLYGQPHGHG